MKHCPVDAITIGFIPIDQACLDMLDQREGKKVFSRGRHALDYAEEIGLGKKNYHLFEIQ